METCNYELKISADNGGYSIDLLLNGNVIRTAWKHTEEGVKMVSDVYRDYYFHRNLGDTVKFTMVNVNFQYMPLLKW